MSEIRTFIAIELPEDIKAELGEIVNQLKKPHEKFVKWVDAYGIHLTLKFLGNIKEEKIVDIMSAIERVSNCFRPFRLKLEGLGSFPNTKSPRVVWIGVGGDLKEVTSLQKQIDSAMFELGFATEKRSFSPHLTLGRVRDRATHKEKLMLGKLIESAEFNYGSSFTVERISLMKSTLTPDGAIYSQIGSTVLDRY